MKNYSTDTIISPGRSFSSILNLLLSILPCILAGEVIAGDGQSDSLDQTVAQSINMLDGKAFEGELGLLGEPASSTDLVTFNDGMFVSKKCQEQCGYTSGKYWLRKQGDQIQVKAMTPCLTSDATILWQGVISGDLIEGSFIWTNRRWYWTFEKEFWFKGKLVESDASANQQQ